MMLIDRLRAHARNSWILDREHRPGQTPKLYVMDRDTASIAAWVADGADESFLQSASCELRIPDPFAWIEFPWKGHLIGILADERKPEEVFAPHYTGPKAEYALDLTLWYWRSMFGTVVKRDEYGGLIWRHEGEHELCGGFGGETEHGHQIQGTFDSAAEVIKGLLYLFNMPGRLRSTTVTPPAQSFRGKPQPPSYSLPLPYVELTAMFDPDDPDGESVVVTHEVGIKVGQQE